MGTTKFPLVLKVWTVQNVVLMKVLHQDGRLIKRGNEDLFYFKKRGFTRCYIKSGVRPAIQGMTIFIYIRGRWKRYDNCVCALENENIREAQKSMRSIKAAVKEFNKQLLKGVGK